MRGRREKKGMKVKGDNRKKMVTRGGKGIRGRKEKKWMKVKEKKRKEIRTR